MNRNFYMSSRPALGDDGGNVNAQAGSLDAVTQYNSGAKNVIRFPSGLPDSRASSRELFILDHDRIARFALGVLIGCVLLAISLSLIAGYLIFDLFDQG